MLTSKARLKKEKVIMASLLFSWVKPAAHCEDTVLLWRGPHSKELSPPANSHVRMNHLETILQDQSNLLILTATAGETQSQTHSAK